MSMERRDFLKLSALVAAETVLFPLGAPGRARAAFSGDSAGNSKQGEPQVYYNAKVYTADRDKPSATAFVIEGGDFVYVGDDRGALAYGRGVDLQGKRVIPGIVDSHCHPALVGVMSMLDMIQLNEHWDLETTLSFLKKAAVDDRHKDLDIILAVGFSVPCSPNRAVDLDRAIPDRPAIIMDAGIHSYWLNTKAMELLNLTRDTPDPIPGSSFYERDVDGNPTGYVVETTAGFTLFRKLSVFTPELIYKAMRGMLPLFSQNGVTTLYDAGFCLFEEETGLKGLRRMEEEGELNTRMFTSYLYLGPAVDSPERMLGAMRANHEKYTTDLVHADSLKMFGDGTIPVQSAWMEKEYLPPASGRGAPVLRLEEMLAAAVPAAAAGFSIHSHAIGDAAILQAMALSEALGDIEGTKTICHVQILPEGGAEKLAEQKNVFYQTTPYWLEDDPFAKEVLGEDRYLRQMPLASEFNAGLRVTFGSDFPASEGEAGVNPFNNIHRAVNRATDGKLAPPPSEAIGVKECIDAYTINGARQLRGEDRFGSITVGKSADFVVCSDDVFAVKPEKIRDVHVEETYLRGKNIYRKA